MRAIMEPQINLLNTCRTCESTIDLLEINAIHGLTVLLESLLCIKDFSKYKQICERCLKTVQQFDALRVKSREVEARLLEIHEVEANLKLDIDEVFLDGNGVASDTEFVEVKLEAEVKEELDKKLPPKKHKKMQKTSKPKVICDECGKSFSIVSNLMKHKKLIHKKSQEKCEFCEKIFYNKTQLEDHLNRHTRKQIFICHYCRKGFYEKRILSRHLREHIRGACYICDKCPASFKTKSNLSTHKRVHQKELFYQCWFCEKQYRTKGGFNDHIKMHKGIQATFPCKVCEKVLGSNKSLKNHMRQHTDERPFVCETCGMGFRRRMSLNKHHFTHSGLRPYMCTVEGCKNGYYNSQYLKTHMLKFHGAVWRPKTDRFEHLRS